MIGHHGVSLNTLALQAFKDRYLMDTRTAENARLLDKVMLLCLDIYVSFFYTDIYRSDCFILLQVVILILLF